MGTVKRRRRKAPPDPLDEADRKSLDSAVESMIQMTLQHWDYTRPIASLNRDDLRKLANAAITGWVLERARLAEEGNTQIREELLTP